MPGDIDRIATGQRAFAGEGKAEGTAARWLAAEFVRSLVGRPLAQTPHGGRIGCLVGARMFAG